MDRFLPLLRGSIDDWTRFGSLAVLFAIFFVLLGVLIVVFISNIKTSMQRGWRSLIIAFNLIMFRSVFLLITQQETIPQPGQIIFLIIVAAFIGHFAVEFHSAWVAPLFGVLGRWRYVVPLSVLVSIIVGVSLALTFYR